MDFDNFPVARDSNRRAAVVRKDTKPQEEEVSRDTMVTSVHEYKNEQVLAGQFTDVQVYFTCKNAYRRSWSDTGIHGNLRVMLLEHIGVPISCVRIHNDRKEVIFEYELPLKFKFE